MTTNEQARADAMADAETLRLYLFAHDWPAYLRVLRSGTLGLAAINTGRIQTARASAYRAFKAVPGLRG